MSRSAIFLSSATANVESLALLFMIEAHRSSLSSSSTKSSDSAPLPIDKNKPKTQVSSSQLFDSSQLFLQLAKQVRGPIELAKQDVIVEGVQSSLNHQLQEYLVRFRNCKVTDATHQT